MRRLPTLVRFEIYHFSQLKKLARGFYKEIYKSYPNFENDKLVEFLKLNLTDESDVDRFVKFFERLSIVMAGFSIYSIITNKLIKNLTKTLNKPMYGINFDSKLYRDFVKDSSVIYTKKIKDLMTSEVNIVSDIVLSGEVDQSEIEEALRKREKTLINIMKNNAINQVLRFSGNIDRMRQQDANYRFFYWQTMEDDRVRCEHVEHTERVTKYGKGIYSWDDLPYSKVFKMHTFPKLEPNCRCIAVPVKIKNLNNDE